MSSFYCGLAMWTQLTSSALVPTVVSWFCLTHDPHKPSIVAYTFYLSTWEAVTGGSRVALSSKKVPSQPVLHFKKQTI